MAQSYTPADFSGSIVQVIDWATIALTVSGAGAILMILWFAWVGGFRLVQYLFVIMFHSVAGQDHFDGGEWNRYSAGEYRRMIRARGGALSYAGRMARSYRR